MRLCVYGGMSAEVLQAEQVALDTAAAPPPIEAGAEAALSVRCPGETTPRSVTLSLDLTPSEAVAKLGFQPPWRLDKVPSAPGGQRVRCLLYPRKPLRAQGVGEGAELVVQITSNLPAGMNSPAGSSSAQVRVSSP